MLLSVFSTTYTYCSKISKIGINLWMICSCNMKSSGKYKRGVPRKRCSENMQQSGSRTPMPKCVFNKLVLQLYWNHTSARVFLCEFSGEFDCFWYSLFNFFRNSQHPEKWSVSFQNFFRKCEYISCYLPISSNLLRISFRKSSLFVFTVTGVIETSVLLAAYFKLLL